MGVDLWIQDVIMGRAHWGAGGMLQATREP
jgi:hypothetical protein